MVTAWALRGRQIDLALMGIYVFIALTLNAIVLGSLAGPFDRFQVRLTWLVTFSALVGVYRWYSLERSES